MNCKSNMSNSLHGKSSQCTHTYRPWAADIVKNQSGIRSPNVAQSTHNKRSCEEVGSMKLIIKHRQIVIFSLLLVSFSIVLIQGCGNSSTQCTAPDGSTITVTGPGTSSISADTNFNFTAVVKTSDGNPMPKACLDISGSFAFPRNATQSGVHYQFYFFPDGTNNPGGNNAVSSPFSAQTDDFGQYTFSALVSVASGSFSDTVIVRSGTNIGTAAFIIN